ncbi:MAG: mechanosensitive ion channel family protein [Desulfobulbaceae bacterium]
MTDSILLRDALRSVAELAENPLVRRLATILFYALLAKVADIFVDRLLRRLAARTRFEADDRIIGFLHRPICYTIVLLGFLHALYLPPALTPPWNLVLPNLIHTLILFLWMVAVIREINLMSESSMAGFLEKSNIDKDLFLLAKNVSRVLILFAGIAWGLLIWDINLTPLFASAGIAGIAIALAAKDTMANFFGGIALFADRAYKVGDYIILDSGQRGEVVEMGIRSTKIRTRDDVMISIPNSILANSMIINESAPEPRFRIRIDVGVAYGSDLKEVEKILLQVAARNEALAAKPEPRVRIRAFADSSVNFQLLVWVRDPSEKGLQTHNLLKAIYRAFEKENITIPFPQRDVHLVNRQAAPNSSPPVAGEDIRS